MRALIVASALRAQGSDVDELQESANGAWTTFLESLEVTPGGGVASGRA